MQRAISALILISVPLLAGLAIFQPALAKGGPIERACERYCDPMFDWFERKTKSAHDALMRRPRQIDPVPVKGKGINCGTMPDGEQKCCQPSERIRVEFRGWRNPYRNPKTEFSSACLPLLTPGRARTPE